MSKARGLLIENHLGRKSVKIKLIRWGREGGGGAGGVGTMFSSLITENMYPRFWSCFYIRTWSSVISQEERACKFFIWKLEIVIFGYYEDEENLWDYSLEARISCALVIK